MPDDDAGPGGAGRDLPHIEVSGMSCRAKLLLDRIDPQLIRRVDQEGRHLIGRIRLSDERGTPRCARVDPPDLEWSSGGGPGRPSATKDGAGGRAGVGGCST